MLRNTLNTSCTTPETLYLQRWHRVEVRVGDLAGARAVEHLEGALCLARL